MALGVLFEPHVEVGREPQADRLGLDQRDVAAMTRASSSRLTRRSTALRRQADLLGELVVGSAAVGLQRAKNASRSIGLSSAFHAWILQFSCVIGERRARKRTKTDGCALQFTDDRSSRRSRHCPSPEIHHEQHDTMPFTPWDNPMGTDGFEFIEYAAPGPGRDGRACSSAWASRPIARHRHKNVTLYRQGEINFIINAEPDSFAQRFARQHGPSICAIAFRVQDAKAGLRARDLDSAPGASTTRPARAS